MLLYVYIYTHTAGIKHMNINMHIEIIYVYYTCIDIFLTHASCIPKLSASSPCISWQGSLPRLPPSAPESRVS